MLEVVKQQRTLEWHKARAGRVTGTSLKRALGSKTVQEKFKYELISQMMSETIPEEINTPAMIRGRDLESQALIVAEELIGCKFETAGFLLSSTIKDFGLSPDGVFRNEVSLNYEGGVEIKCPNTATHIQYLIGDVVPKDYWHQMIAPFVADDNVLWWYFLSYDPRSYERKTFLKKIIREDIEKEIESARKSLTKFISEVNYEHKKITF